nr:MAG TPA: hypothetical protein [Caudoviricetes sp.]
MRHPSLLPPISPSYLSDYSRPIYIRDDVGNGQNVR